MREGLRFIVEIVNEISRDLILETEIIIRTRYDHCLNSNFILP